MRYQWDEEKRKANVDKHGEDFADAAQFFDWSRAQITPDTRHDYGESLLVACGPRHDGRVMVLTFTVRGPDIRIISYRKANRRERSRYEQTE